MTTTTAPAPLFVHDNGQITCPEHGGAYLAAAHRTHPDRRQHRTPLGTWGRLDARFAELWAEQTDAPLACETCGAPNDPAPMDRRCEACGAEAGEPCRPLCIGEGTQLDDIDPATWRDLTRDDFTDPTVDPYWTGATTR